MSKQITERDLEIVHWLGCVKLATAVQVQTRFGLWRSKAYARLKCLREHGLVAHERGVPGDGVWTATRLGLKTINLWLPTARVRLSTLVHDLAVTEAMITLENASAAVLGEREMRQTHRAEGSSTYLITVNDSRYTHPIKHLPDIAIQGPKGKWVAVEIELTAKTAARTREILEGYRRAPHQHRKHQSECVGVLYITPTDRDQQRLTKLAEQAWLGKQFATALKNQPEQIKQAAKGIINHHREQTDRQARLAA